jgi:hypothetical protein
MIIASLKLFRLDVVVLTRCEVANRASRPFADCWRDGANAQAFVENVELVMSWLPAKSRRGRVLNAT